MPKSGHVTITKIENLHTVTRGKFSDSKNASYSCTTKNNEVIAEKPFPNSGVTRRLWTLGRLELTLVNTFLVSRCNCNLLKQSYAYIMKCPFQDKPNSSIYSSSLRFLPL